MDSLTVTRLLIIQQFTISFRELLFFFRKGTLYPGPSICVGGGGEKKFWGGKGDANFFMVFKRGPEIFLGSRRGRFPQYNLLMKKLSAPSVRFIINIPW